MNTNEKEITYISTNSYSTLNKFTNRTKHVWFVCHGMGYLSRYFLKYFKALNPEENYIIAPQAPSKFYQGKQFKHVGASWLTKENTQTETDNILNYLNAVWQAEQIPNNINFIALGYSQGVSIISRWIAKQQIACQYLVLLSGGLPKELKPEDFSFLKNTQIIQSYGTNDEYLNEERMIYETARSKELFGECLQIIPFEGTHVVNVNLINNLL